MIKAKMKLRKSPARISVLLWLLLGMFIVSVIRFDELADIRVLGAANLAHGSDRMDSTFTKKRDAIADGRERPDIVRDKNSRESAPRR